MNYRLGWVIPHADGGAVLLHIKETWLRHVGTSWLHSVSTGKKPCVKEMKTGSHSRGLKSKTGCLWESSVMWSSISSSLLGRMQYESQDEFQVLKIQSNKYLMYSVILSKT
jgi:hypothetical protein